MAIGSATVSEDGSSITSDLGAGVIKAGWHCGGNPNTTGSAGTCPTCKKCQGASCVPVAGTPACDDKDGCTANDRCQNGACKGDPIRLNSVEAGVSGERRVSAKSASGKIDECPLPRNPSFSFSAATQQENCVPRYNWTFGDGTSSTVQNPTHEFRAVGTYQVSLVVQCEGCAIQQKSDSVSIQVEEGRTYSSIEADYRTMATNARFIGWDVAAGNLEHFLGASGNPLVLNSGWLLGYGAITDAVAVNQGRFIDNNLAPTIAGLAPGQSVQVVDHWDRQISTNPFSGEIFYASGSSTLTSTGTFTISKAADGTVTVTGTVVHDWRDPYDWHDGLTAPIPGFGNVPDADANCLVAAGRAKTFNMTSSWQQRVNSAPGGGGYTWSN
ncbi:hypothetical protein RA210_U230049 [Rubrivivax sp. A210]|nr:hypothetical protein RA210_U230049 [Rubrivivax sp. A210]